MIKEISNVSSTLIINTYEGFYCKDKSIVDKIIFDKYSNKNLIYIIKKIVKEINAEILNESTHNFEPFGDSTSLLIKADINLANSGTLHLKESHITYHTYIETRFDNFYIIRLEIHICSCTKVDVFKSLPHLFDSDNIFFKNFLPDVISIDYLKRGYDLASKNGNSSGNFDTLEIFKLYNIVNQINSIKSSGFSHLLFLLDKKSLREKLETQFNGISNVDIDSYFSLIEKTYCNY